MVYRLPTRPSELISTQYQALSNDVGANCLNVLFVHALTSEARESMDSIHFLSIFYQSELEVLHEMGVKGNSPDF